MSSQINSVTVGGRLTADPELREVNDQHVLEVRIAVGRSFKDGDVWKDAASFIPVTIWNGRARHIARVAKKGDLLHFSGEIRSQEWTAEDGSKRSRVFILANNVEGEALFRRVETADAEADQPELIPA